MSLTVVYSQEEPPIGFAQSIFLVGPSPRESGVASWRPEAIHLLEKLGYTGVVFVPEPRGERTADLGPDEYLHRVGWETRCLNMADIILCWLPRDLQTLPGFTTNAVFGMWFDSGKIVFGGPEGAYKNRYLEFHALQRGVLVAHTLAETVANALELLGEGAWREGGEREVPLLVWRTLYFKRWYAKLCASGNVLEHARLMWSHRTGPGKRLVFFWVLWAAVYITTEKRIKPNEMLLSRPDISTVVAYRRRGANINDAEIVLVEEFRTASGQVLEPPSGSSRHTNDPLQTATEEIAEETGLKIDPARLKSHGEWGIQATLSVQHCHLYSVELTEDELDIARQHEREGTVHGVEADTERTQLRVHTLRTIREGSLVDLSMLGAILHVLTSN